MGNKINPLGFRLGFTQNHRSHWFAQQRDYSEDLREDEKIHNCIENYIQLIKSSSNYGGLARIEIGKKIDLFNIKIYIGFPNLLTKRPGVRQEMKKLRNDIQYLVLQNRLSVHRELFIFLEKVAKPYREPNILAEYIALQIKNRVPFRKTMQKAMELAKEAGVKGIRIQIAGRLDGKERARAESTKQGRVPLQTIRAKIDYGYYAAQTIYGVLGIKIWIFEDEE
uniref:Small ribosomal subunit protein uS3c n=17 Tax=Araucaria TaxID=25666 RepID=A0A0B5H6H0_9CONI|nr:ribosomal protein S3 [Araucaria heterophylla]YP_009512048.1 ribosomal protein S3 [Araucaria angustifolia]YP_009722057.1 ribosomal protein S3 [Araucaria araucana]YP_009917302.1 ribosomal protein S3 [Araucaria cunninghamii]AJF41936.1 ribosomal protein S3 [Araucaria muelleri]AJF42017.1 ribosomal protein S3 [Araucaria scopulorum]AJF42181.1 ribosomal protein S3 [Araucaria bernieri]AJF42261.1 ribosomal protein S3 [Araucaria luxurians]AJF42340.1 ribosomal protein S3 [Araucaria subulata]AJF4242